jgi:prolyl 4-hydroxylase
MLVRMAQRFVLGLLSNIVVYKLVFIFIDRLPLVLSAIINVDQDVDEPWPLEVYGRDGIAVNVTMVPGDMLLYESHSIIHGRPFPLHGRFMANMFVHFEPVGPKNTAYDPSIESSSGLPPYIIPNSELAKEWLELYPEPRRPRVTSYTSGSSYAHYAAKEGSLDQLILEYEKNRKVIHEFDAEGYTPLHWAVQRDHLPLVQFLISKGADRDVASRDSNNATSLWWARSLYSGSHPIVQFLRQIGALDIGPEL